MVQILNWYAQSLANNETCWNSPFETSSWESSLGCCWKPLLYCATTQLLGLHCRLLKPLRAWPYLICPFWVWWQCLCTLVLHQVSITALSLIQDSKFWALHFFVNGQWCCLSDICKLFYPPLSHWKLMQLQHFLTHHWRKVVSLPIPNRVWTIMPQRRLMWYVVFCDLTTFCPIHRTHLHWNIWPKKNAN